MSRNDDRERRRHQARVQELFASTSAFQRGHHDFTPHDSEESRERIAAANKLAHRIERVSLALRMLSADLEDMADAMDDEPHREMLDGIAQKVIEIASL